ncbi:MAG TPA: mechanosensitive ion channel family protein, partial [Gemmatimonadaceae bacterium]|nr:mechanosensitive ion channel family protein [Gemmatimonadaceae bacterium]
VVTFLTERSITRRQQGPDRFGVTAIRALGMGAKLFCWFLVALTAIQLVFGQTASSLLTGLGVGGIALALAVQNILGDLLATLAIAFDRPFDVGDAIGVDAIVGTVEHIGLKTTRIRSITGEEIVIGNADLLKSRLHNYRRMQERRVVLLADLSPDTSADMIERLPAMIREIINAQPDVRFDRSHFAGLTDAAFRVETVYYVLDRDYARFMDAQQAIDLAVVRRLRREGIRFAFPTRSTYVDPASAVPPPAAATATATAVAADTPRSVR